MLAVLGPGDHRQAGVHGPALRDMIGDRVPEFRISEMWIQESAVGPPPLPGGRVGVQGPADDQAAWGDGLDAEQVAVGQRPAGLAGLDGVVQDPGEVGVVAVDGRESGWARAIVANGFCAITVVSPFPSETVELTYGFVVVPVANRSNLRDPDVALR